MRKFILLLATLLYLPISASAAPILIQYQAEVRTTTGFLGYTYPLGTPVSGYFLFDTSIADSNININRGHYQHAGNGGFTANLTAFDGGNPVALAIAGSGSPEVRVEWFPAANDTWRFLDGLPDYGTMTVNGLANPNVDLGFAMSQPIFFASDANTNPWPLASFPGTAHTFSLSDSNGTILLQITNVTAVPEPATWALPTILGCWLLRRRLRRCC